MRSRNCGIRRNMVHKNHKLGPVLTSDIIIIDSKKEVLLTRRNITPYKGWWAIPGGHVEMYERVSQAAIREIKEETGLKVKIVDFLGIYDSPKRDPRGHSVCITYIAKIVSGKLQINSEVSEFGWFALNKLPKKLAFDHQQMLNDFKKCQKKF